MKGDGCLNPYGLTDGGNKGGILSGYTQATFILAPMAIALREQGVKIKIIYLGHGNGSALMVHKDSKIFRMEDLRGKDCRAKPVFQPAIAFVSRVEKSRMNVKDVDYATWLPPTCQRHFLRKSLTRFMRRTVHGADRARRLRPRPLADERCVAKFHFLRARRP